MINQGHYCSSYGFGTGGTSFNFDSVDELSTH